MAVRGAYASRALAAFMEAFEGGTSDVETAGDVRRDFGQNEDVFTYVLEGRLRLNRSIILWNEWKEGGHALVRPRPCL